MASWIVYPFMATYDVKVIIISSIALLLFHHLYAMLYDLYNKVWSYASVGELSAIARAVTLSIVSTGLFQLLINDLTIYRRVLLVTWMLHIIIICSSRFIWCVYRVRYISVVNETYDTVIVDAVD